MTRICDTRFSDEGTRYELSHLQGEIVVYLVHGIRSRGQICEAMAEVASPAAVDLALEELLQHRFLLKEDHRFVSLVLPERCYTDDVSLDKLREQDWATIGQEKKYPGLALSI